MAKKKQTQGEGIYPYYLKNGELRYEAYAFNGVNKGTGKQKKKHKKGFLSHAAAKKWKRITEGEFATEDYIATNAGDIRLSVYLEDWLNVHKPNLKLGSRIKYQDAIKYYILPYIGNFKLNQYSPADHQKYINFLLNNTVLGKNKKGLSMGSVRSIHQTISSFLNTAVKLGYIKSNPAENVVFPKSKKEDTLHYFTYEQTEIFLDEAKKQKEPVWYPLFLTIFDQGLRKGEALGLVWDDIDFANNMIHVRRTRIFAAERKRKLTFVVDSPKTDSSTRELPMTKRTKNALLVYRNYVINLFGYLPKTGENQFIFIKTNHHGNLGTPFRGESINLAMTRIIESRGLPKISVHDGRHTYAVRLREAGVDLNDIGDLLGHTDTKTTQIYAHITPEIKERAVDRLETYLNSQAKI